MQVCACARPRVIPPEYGRDDEGASRKLRTRDGVARTSRSPDLVTCRVVDMQPAKENRIAGSLEWTTRLRDAGHFGAAERPVPC